MLYAKQNPEEATFCRVELTDDKQIQDHEYISHSPTINIYENGQVKRSTANPRPEELKSILDKGLRGFNFATDVDQSVILLKDKGEYETILDSSLGLV